MTERRPHPSGSGRTTAHPSARSSTDKPTGNRQPRADGRSERPLRQPVGSRPPARDSSRRGSSRPSSSRPSSSRPSYARSSAAQLRAHWGRRIATLRLPLAPSTRRLHAVLVVVAVGLSLCGGRLLQLQGFDSSAYAATTADQFTRTLPLLPSRGEITDRNGAVLASTQPAVAVTADPTLTSPADLDPTARLAYTTKVAGILSGYLGMTTTDLMPLLTKPNTHFVYLKKQVPALTYSRLSDALSQQGIYGVFRESDPVRTYPAGSTAASVVGFVNGDGTGVAGIESELNSSLAGVEGKETYESAPNGNKIPLGGSSITPAQNGVNAQLTIDSQLQYTAEQLLAAAVKKTDADSAFAITMDVKTGEVLAMANVPSFTPGKVRAEDVANTGNRAVSDAYEPGSVEKVLTSAALIDSGTATPTTKVKIPNSLPSGGAVIHDHYTHPELHYNMRGVVAKSLNIGTALLARQMSKQQLHDYLASFGLGRPTGIEVPNEASGVLPSATMSDGQRDRAAFGQAISVTGVQEAAAIAGIINGGIYNPPTLVKSQTDAAGTVLPNPQHSPRRVVSAATSASVRGLMAAVVDNQQNLALDAYDTGGKTGTAQLASPKCHCYPKNSYVTSYVNFAPLDDPKLMTYVVITHPRHGDTGSGTAAPVVRDIMDQALPRYSVAPDKTNRKALPITW